MLIDRTKYKTIGRSNLLETPKPMLLLLLILVVGFSILAYNIPAMSLAGLMFIIPILNDMRVFTQIHIGTEDIIIDNGIFSMFGDELIFGYDEIDIEFRHRLKIYGGGWVTILKKESNIELCCLSYSLSYLANIHYKEIMDKYFEATYRITVRDDKQSHY